MKRRDLENRLRGIGWRFAHHGARHDIWAKGEQELAVPRHNEINEYTARGILREAQGGR
ncbi:MAG: type II toxin-antitoxin system HicA family toxin [Candidatus Aureabacteria bacterium]|nr:type II toxin-antitoxin system HicA family toxin [Candidatus Auribacterota bacterium]